MLSGRAHLLALQGRELYIFDKCVLGLEQK